MKTLAVELTRRFLSWSLPKDFAPDGYINFDKAAASAAKSHWPTGTNLLHAGQAAEMFEHCLQLWQPIETAPKSRETEHGVEGVYILGFCPEPDLSNLESCICVVWWEPNMKGGKGMWYGEGGFETRPTHWMPLPRQPAL